VRPGFYRCTILLKMPHTKRQQAIYPEISVIYAVIKAAPIPIMKISIIIPVLNEAGQMTSLMHSLRPFMAQGHEVIVVDGGSSDSTPGIADALGARVFVMKQPSRARQMNAGIRKSTGDAMVFLHADTRLPENAMQLVSDCLELDYYWGRFNVRLSGRSPAFRLIERMMNLRSCVTGIATGDQAIFISREGTDVNGPFPDIPLMEDVQMSKNLRSLLGRPACVRAFVTTSSRRWEERGTLRTILLMWRLRLKYFLGTSAEELAELYR
jgi:rSAM/selenodomain-associated transferase 2